MVIGGLVLYSARDGNDANLQLSYDKKEQKERPSDCQDERERHIAQKPTTTNG